MKFATVLAALTIANANGQKRHHAIRRVQEDQSMSMMLDPNKRTKETATTRRSTKTTTTSGDMGGCDFDLTGDWAPAEDICKVSFELPLVFFEPNELDTTNICSKNHFIRLTAEEDGTIQGLYSYQYFVGGEALFSEIRSAPLIGFWNNKNGECNFSVVDTDSSLTIEGSILDDELHVEATAPGGCDECLAPGPPPFGFLPGPFPFAFQGAFTKKDDVCMDTDTPEDEVCREIGPDICNLQCCIDDGNTEEECFELLFELGPEEAFQRFYLEPSCACADTVNVGCPVSGIIQTHISVGESICGKASSSGFEPIDLDSYKYIHTGGIFSVRVVTTFPNIIYSFWVLTEDGLCNDDRPDEFPFSRVLPVPDVNSGEPIPPNPEDVSFYDTIEKSYDLPAGQYAFQVSAQGDGLECDSPLDGKYRISVFKGRIKGVPVTTEFQSPFDDIEQQSMEDLKKSYMTKLANGGRL